MTNWAGVSAEEKAYTGITEDAEATEKKLKSERMKE